MKTQQTLNAFVRSESGPGYDEAGEITGPA
jgi:hypothetical protein